MLLNTVINLHLCFRFMVIFHKFLFILKTFCLCLKLYL
jgi:hypothetical protein